MTNPDQAAGRAQPARIYEIRVRGHLGPTLLSAFDGLQGKSSGGETLLTGALDDQATLFGVLNEIETLGLELLEFRRLPAPPSGSMRRTEA